MKNPCFSKLPPLRVWGELTVVMGKEGKGGNLGRIHNRFMSLRMGKDSWWILTG